MANLSFTAKAPGQYTVSGDLTFATINQKTVNLCAIPAGTSQICIDLAEVNKTDSAGLALMIEWIRIYQQKQIDISFKHIPEQLLALAKLSGLDENEHFASPASERLPS